MRRERDCSGPASAGDARGAAASAGGPIGGLVGPAEEPARALVVDLGVELAEGLVGDLADALAGDADVLRDLLERQRLLAVKAEAEAEDPGLTLVDGVEQAADGAEFIVRRAQSSEVMARSSARMSSRLTTLPSSSSGACEGARKALTAPP